VPRLSHASPKPLFQECRPGHYLGRKFLLSDDRMGMTELRSKFSPLSICWTFLPKIFMHPQVPMCSKLTKAVTRLTTGLAICWPFLKKIFMQPQVPMCFKLRKAATRLTTGLASGKIIRTNVQLKHFKNTSLNPVPNAQVCVYLMIHIEKLPLQTTFSKPLYISHFACIHLDPWLLKILMFAVLVTCEIATYS